LVQSQIQVAAGEDVGEVHRGGGIKNLARDALGGRERHVDVAAGDRRNRGGDKGADGAGERRAVGAANGAVRGIEGDLVGLDEVVGHVQDVAAGVGDAQAAGLIGDRAAEQHAARAIVDDGDGARVLARLDIRVEVVVGRGDVERRLRVRGADRGDLLQHQVLVAVVGDVHERQHRIFNDGGRAVHAAAARIQGDAEQVRVDDIAENDGAAVFALDRDAVPARLGLAVGADGEGSAVAACHLLDGGVDVDGVVGVGAAEAVGRGGRVGDLLYLLGRPGDAGDAADVGVVGVVEPGGGEELDGEAAGDDGVAAVEVDGGIEILVRGGVGGGRARSR